MSDDTLPEWERVISAAAHLQRILPEAVLVGGTASALYAKHRLSVDADHVLTDLRMRFDVIIAELESVSGWRTARITRPVQIPGSLDGIETGIRQLIRQEPLETTLMDCCGVQVTIPSTLFPLVTEWLQQVAEKSYCKNDFSDIIGQFKLCSIRMGNILTRC